jgi:hypothetical protein
MPGVQNWNIPQANSNLSGGRALNPVLALFAGRRANVERLNNLEMQSKAQVWTADQKAGNEVKHAKLHANHMANAQVGDELDDRGNVTKKATNPDGTPIANPNHGKPFSAVMSGIRVGQTSTTFQKLGNTAHESNPDKKRKSGGKNRGGGAGRDASITDMVAGIKAGHFSFEEATGPGGAENWTTESSFGKGKSSKKGAGQASDAPGPMSKKFAQDYAAHVAGGGNEESYLNQFGDSGRRRRKKNPPPGNNGGNS